MCVCLSGHYYPSQQPVINDNGVNCPKDSIKDSHMRFDCDARIVPELCQYVEMDLWKVISSLSTSSSLRVPHLQLASLSGHYYPSQQPVINDNGIKYPEHQR